MKARTILTNDLITLGKWRADLHVHSSSEVISERFELIPLREVVIESKIAKDPKEMSPREFFYIGLEHVEPITGEHHGIELTTCENIKSRSKAFEAGDILYGRLRPYLRKALYVEEPISSGLCSTEFIVLKAKQDIILPLYLREILVSNSITELVSRMQAGAALPRISSKDLLNISIPVPPIDFQKMCVEKINKSIKRRRQLLQEIAHLSEEGQNIISEVFN